MIRTFQAEKVPRPPLPLANSPWQGFAAVDLEIGAGQGHFARQYCRSNPDRALIALERTRLRSEDLLSENLDNLFAYRADAVAFVTHFIGDESLDRIFLLYPNPYPKAKQANQRWYNMPFMSCLLAKLKPGGTLELRTNIESYYREAEQRLVNDWGLNVVVSSPIATASPLTLFEKKYLARGEVCYRLIVQK